LSIRCKGNADHAAAACLDHVTSHDVVWTPVGPLDEYVRLNRANHGLWRVLIEDHDSIDAGETEEDFGALPLRIDRSVRSLDNAHGPVRVDGDDERVAKCARVA
jgi:hypothetical protein